MKNYLLILLAILFPALAGAQGLAARNDSVLSIFSKMSANGKGAQPVIVVADYCSDIGESHGLKQRLAEMDQGLIRIVGYITSITNEGSAATLAYTLAKYGHPEIPVGVSRTNYYTVSANVTNAIYRAFANGIPMQLANSNYASDVDIFRSILAAWPNNSLAIDWEGDLGPWYNLSLTTNDVFSTLSGTNLLAKKTLYHLINGGDTNNYDFSATVTIANAGDLLTHAALVNAQTGQPVQITGAGTVPAQITKDTTYYLIKVSATTSQLATTYSNAVNNVAIVLNSDSSGALTIEDFLKDGPYGDYNLHVGGPSGFLPVNMPAIVNAVTNKIVWIWNKIPYFYPPWTTDPAQELWVGQNVNNSQIHPAWYPIYQDATNYNYIFGGSSAQKPPWDGVASLFLAGIPAGFGTNLYDGTRLFDMSPAGKCTLSTLFPGHVYWTNNPANAGEGTSNHFYITITDSFRNSITNVINKFIDAPPYPGYAALVPGAAYNPTATTLGLLAGGTEFLRGFGDDFYQPGTGYHFWISGAFGTGADSGIGRNAAGVVEVNNGTPGTLAAIKAATHYVGATATVTAGTGTPEAVVTAPVGSIFLRTDGGVSTTLYVKTSGAGNTGWTAK